MARMHAQVGDWLIVGEDRVGEVVGIRSADGSPPYIVKWLKDGHIAMVFPDPYARVVPGPHKDTEGPGVTV